MPLFGRKDGDLVRDLPATRRIVPFLMTGRNESAVYFEQRIDAAPGLAFIARWNEAHPDQKISFFHLLLRAIVLTLDERPRLNRFTMGKRIYQRRSIQVSYSAKKKLDDESPMFVVKHTFDPRESFEAMVARLYAGLREGRSDRKSHVDKELRLLLALPAFVLSFLVWLMRRLDAWNLLPYAVFREDPMYASVFIANLGSLKMDAAYHHGYEYGNIPVFVVVGRVQDAVVAKADGSVGTRKEIVLKWTYDERIEDGLYCMRALERLRERLERADGPE